MITYWQNDCEWKTRIESKCDKCKWLCLFYFSSQVQISRIIDEIDRNSFLIDTNFFCSFHQLKRPLMIFDFILTISMAFQWNFLHFIASYSEHCVPILMAKDFHSIVIEATMQLINCLYEKNVKIILYATV